MSNYYRKSKFEHKHKYHVDDYSFTSRDKYKYSNYSPYSSRSPSSSANSSELDRHHRKSKYERERSRRHHKSHSRSNSHSKHRSHRRHKHSNRKDSFQSHQSSSSIIKKDPVNSNEREPSNTLLVTNLGVDINPSILDDVFREKCLDYQTSMPEDIRFIEAIKVAYIIFPSIAAATKILESLNGKILINGHLYDISFTPNITHNPVNPQTSFTYIQSIADSSTFSTSLETTVHEDWICEYCGFKNFSTRAVCLRCKKSKTLNCRIIPVIRQKTTMMGAEGQVPPSTSIMIRGNIIKETDETELLEIFSAYAQVKDIRMIRDRVTGEIKDFAFIEYFTLEEATNAVEVIKKSPIKIRGVAINTTYSKIKKQEEEALVLKKPQIGHEEANDSFMKIIHTIGSSDQLNGEDKDKLKNITELQTLIEKTQNSTNTVIIKDTRGESNLRREVIQREKVQLEMKKWEKKIGDKKIIQETVNKDNTMGLSCSLRDAFAKYDIGNIQTDDSTYEVVQVDFTKKRQGTSHAESISLPMDNFNQGNNQNISINNNNINNNFFCFVCSRKFPSEEKLKMHENMSALHKENLEKQNSL